MASAPVLTREIPDSSLAGAFAGEALVQSFAVTLPGGRTGRVWITTAEALTVPGFGRAWVAGQLVALRSALGTRAFDRALIAGLRLRAEAPELALAA